MRTTTAGFAVTISIFLLLSITPPASSQVVGCDGNGIDCPTSNDLSTGDICAYSATTSGVGIVSFNSNISDSPLTWTLTEEDRTPQADPFTQRSFYLGTSPSLDFENVTDYGACAFTLGSNTTAALQLPSGYNDTNAFGCHTVMGEACAQDILDLVHNELLRTIDDASDQNQTSMCRFVSQSLDQMQLPPSCVEPFATDLLTIGAIQTLTNRSYESWIYQTQDNCTMTTGGQDYNIVAGPTDQFHAAASSREVARYKNGTTALFTLFYNEPWNNASTGPNLALIDPEVHLSCLRKVPTAEQLKAMQSASTRLHIDLSIAWLLVFGSWLVHAAT